MPKKNHFYKKLYLLIFLLLIISVFFSFLALGEEAPVNKELQLKIIEKPGAESTIEITPIEKPQEDKQIPESEENSQEEITGTELNENPVEDILTSEASLNSEISDNEEVETNEIYIGLDEIMPNKSEKIKEDSSEYSINNTSPDFSDTDNSSIENLKENQNISEQTNNNTSLENSSELKKNNQSENLEDIYKYVELENIIKNASDEEENTSSNEIVNNVKHDRHEDKEKTKNLSLNESKEINQKSDSSDKAEEEKEISYVFYKGNKKEIETKALKGEKVEIKKNEKLLEKNENEWKKEVKVSSKEHFENQLTVYTDIIEREDSEIKIYWKETGKYVDFKSYDLDNNGLYDRISWVVPHLSNQTFEITINITKNNNTSPSQKNIAIDILKAPIGNVNYSLINFNFNISSNSLTDIKCNFSIENSNGTIKKSEVNTGKTNYSITLENGAYSWNVECYDSINSSIKNSSSGNFYILIDYTPKIRFFMSNSTIKAGDSVYFYINVSRVIDSEMSYILDFGDGDSVFGGIPPIISKTLNEQIAHTYETKGNYTINFTVYIDGVPFNNSESLYVSDNYFVDDEAPVIDLIEPLNEEMIIMNNRSGAVTFSYTANDNIKIDNCTFNIYYYNNSLIGSLVYSKFNNTISSGSRDSIELSDFDEGDYSWDVECYDNSSNYNEKDRDFNISYKRYILNNISSILNYTYNFSNINYNTKEIKEIDELIDSINYFFIKEEKLSASEREAIEDLGIRDELKLYKKKALQMKIDLEHNLDYIKEENLRDERKQEIIKEIEDMRLKVPIDFRISDEYEYVKNSVEFNTEWIMEDYMKSKGISLDKKNIGSMAKENEKIQDYISSSTKAKQVEIDYNETIEEITLITKNIDIKNNSFDSIIEIVPKEVAENSSEIEFINKYRLINSDPVFEVKISDLKDNKIIYYIKKIVDLKNMEKTTTIPFKERIPKNSLNPITGFVTFISPDEVNSYWFYLSWILVAIVIFAIVITGIKKSKIKSLKKKDKTKEIFRLIDEIKKALKEKNNEKARDRYNQAKEIYSNIPQKHKKIIYKRLEKIFREIDKREIIDLVKEFISASRENRKEDASLIYRDIQKIYHRISKKDKRKIYEKMSPYLKSIK